MNPIISLRILALVATGKTIPEAMDAVLGAGAFEQIAGDVYDGLRK